MSTAKAYAMVNAAWPATRPPLTGAEAIKAARILMRVGLAAAPAKVRGARRTFKLTSGNRHNAIWEGIINPDHGWHALVHHISHYCHRRVYPNKGGHDGHAIMEKRLIDEVLKRGWLDGRLKPKPRAVKPRNLVSEREARVLKRLADWERKRKRAATAIKKLERQAAYYRRRVAAPSARAETLAP